MNLLVVGAGSGSWAMRGVQLGRALGAHVTTHPSADDWRRADLAILVKRAADRWAVSAHEHGVPFVWDALDFWQQPSQNALSEAAAEALLLAAIARLRPVLTIGATQAMADACGGRYVPHHSWQGLAPTPPRPRVNIVAYEGNPAYLGAWQPLLERGCARRGWQFIVNPSSWTDVDIVVALRDGRWNGFMCAQWKSGVKLVNAIAAGRPVLTQRTAAALELPATVELVDDVVDLDEALTRAADATQRDQAYVLATRLAEQFTLQRVAARYAEILQTVRAICAV